MKVKFLQEGGEMTAQDPAMAGAPAAPEAAPAAGNEEEQVMQQVYQMAQGVIQQVGPEVAMMLAQAIMEMVQGGAAAAEEQMPAPEEQPVYKMGGQLAKRGRR